MSDDFFSKGMAVRRSTLGDAYVDQAEKKKNTFDEEFQAFITRTAWGSVWARDGISKRERSMITIGILAALGHHDELALHLKAICNTGASMEDIREVLLHVAVYAGIPAANTAFKIAKAHFAASADPVSTT
jgi:4-carboxymuconolactone decarboxylase